MLRDGTYWHTVHAVLKRIHEQLFIVRPVSGHCVCIMCNPRQSLQKTGDQLQGAWQALSAKNFNEQRQGMALAILCDPEETSGTKATKIANLLTDPHGPASVQVQQRRQHLAGK